jgi:LacI family repressor for deo operon, udp, cdd, tsx, nupC, and nupG
LLALDGWRSRVDAMFCGNDILAIAAMDALREAGVEIGKDLSLVGLDDIPAAANTSPALTTVRKPRALIGAAAAELLLARISEPDRPPEKRLYPGELITRGSVTERHYHEEQKRNTGRQGTL